MEDKLKSVYPGLPFLTNAVVVLASASPRRRELLGRLLPPSQFQVLAADIDESVQAGETPNNYVRRMAIEKVAKGVAMAAGLRKPGSGLLVIGADTSVVLANKIYGKPGTPEKAITMLGELGGRTHQVMSGVAVQLVGANGQVTSNSLVCTTEVEMRRATSAEIEWYVETGEPLDKAGAYAVQGFGGVLVAAVRGDYYNVVGLPLGPLVDLLRQLEL